MAIDVEWQDEQGNRVAVYDGPPIDGRLPTSAPANSVCLKFIDPYGDTTFNSAQVVVLEAELESVSGADDIAAQARSLLGFVRAMTDRTHRYLKFLGD